VVIDGPRPRNGYLRVRAGEPCVELLASGCQPEGVALSSFCVGRWRVGADGPSSGSNDGPHSAWHTAKNKEMGSGGRLLGKPIEIENPFIWNIKSDVVRSIVDRGCADLIKDTVSCTRTREMRKEHSHCGCCSQCIDRRFGVLAAGAAEYDPVEKYKVELLAGERDKGEDKTMAESYARTALELRDISEFAFFSRFAGLTSRVCDGFPSITADEIRHCAVRSLRR
jgi:hypothetical protein